MTDRTLIGRDNERGQVAAHVRPGTTGALVIVGEAGIGKSSLWSEGIDTARSHALRVVAAAPAEAERDLSFAVLGDLLGGLLSGQGLRLAAPQRQALEVALHLRESDGVPVDSLAIGLATAAVLAEVSYREEVLLAIDDLQWVDAASAAAIAFALRRICRTEARLRVLGTARTPWNPAGRVGLRLADVVLLPLGGLSLGATQRLLVARLDRGLTHSWLRRIHDAGRGNPLHCLELARSLNDSPHGPQETSFRPGLDLSELVLRRLSSLPASTREVLLLASLTEQPTIAALRSALGRSVEEALAEATAVELVHVDGDRVWFRHPLYASACAQLFGSDACRAAHARLAGAVDGAESRARHLALATREPDDGVAAEVDLAAVSARMRGAPAAAAELATLAIRLTPGEDTAGRTRRVCEAARYLAESGDTAAAVRFLSEELEHAAPGADRCRVLLLLGRIAYDAHGVQAARRVSRQAIEAAGSDALLRAETLLAHVERSQLPAAGRRALAVEALDDLRSHGEAPAGLVAQALREIALADYHVGAGMPKDLMREAITLEQEVRPPPAVAWRASTILGECLKYVDEFDEAGRLLRIAGDDAEREGDLASIAEIAGHRAELALWQGDWDRAAVLSGEAVAAARQTEQDGRLAMALHFEAMVRVHRGEVTAGREAVADGAVAASRAEDEWVQMLLASDEAFLELSLGDLTAAHGHYAAVDRTASRRVLSEPRQWRYLGDHVQVLAALGDTRTATDRLDRLRQWGDRAGGWGQAMTSRASAHVCIARGDQRAALAHFEAAESAFADLRLPFPLARTQFERGALLRRQGRRRAAREDLATAHTGFVALGAAIWARRCAEEQARLGGRVPRDDSGLTSAEEAVARIVAQGASNREAARVLSISPRTVEVHLGRIYHKLDLHTRAQLAARYR